MDKITEQRIERVAAGLGRDVEASLFSIRSSSSDTELAFSGARKDYFTVELKGNNEVRVIRQIYAYSPHSPNLGTFFIRIAHHNRPWARVEFWESRNSVSSRRGKKARTNNSGILMDVLRQYRFTKARISRPFYCVKLRKTSALLLKCFFAGSNAL